MANYNANEMFALKMILYTLISQINFENYISLQRRDHFPFTQICHGTEH
jgi:hypothetical protein